LIISAFMASGLPGRYKVAPVVTPFTQTDYITVDTANTSGIAADFPAV
jgi:hypothetical protein